MQPIRLREAADTYRQHLVAKGLSPRTAESRYYAIRKLAESCGDLVCGKVEPRHIDTLFSDNAHWSPSSRNNQVLSLRKFFEWCRFRRITGKDHDPMFGWGRVKYAHRDRLRIPVDEWPRLFEACQTPIERITLAIGLYLFLRASEMKALKLCHVHLSENLIEVYRSKTRQWDTMPISSELESHLRAHLTWLAERGVTQPDAYLIPARAAGSRLRDNRGVFQPQKQMILNPERPHAYPWFIVQGVLERLGYPKKHEGGHTLRRTGARAYFDQLRTEGYDSALRDVQAMLGHASVTTTEIYLGLNLDRQRRNKRLAGQPMFPAVAYANVIPIRQEM